MDITILGIIAIGIVGVFFAVFSLVGRGGKSSTSKTTTAVKTVESVAATKEGGTSKEVKRKSSEIPRKDMFSFMEFDKIMDDMIMQEKETKYTMVVQCKGINYDLMSEIEQLAVEEGFITFLNTLKFPIQLYVQARAVNLKTSLDMYKQRTSEINRQFEESNEKFKKLSDNINVSDKELQEANLEKERLINISEYAQDITKYVEKLSLNKHMLQRKFYVVISYYKSEVNTTSEFTKEEIKDICYRELYTRAQSIIGGLQSCSVSGKVLDSNELAELLYISYNRDDEKLMDIKTALDSGFYRLYSTSKDVIEKKKELMDAHIQEEAMNRVREAIDKAISSGIIKTEDQLIEEYENETDVQAVKILEGADISEKDKRKIQQIIVDDHNKKADEREKTRQKKLKEQKEKMDKELEEKEKVEEKVEEKASSSETDSIV